MEDTRTKIHKTIVSTVENIDLKELETEIVLLKKIKKICENYSNVSQEDTCNSGDSGDTGNTVINSINSKLTLANNKYIIYSDYKIKLPFYLKDYSNLSKQKKISFMNKNNNSVAEYYTILIRYGYDILLKENNKIQYNLWIETGDEKCNAASSDSKNNSCSQPCKHETSEMIDGDFMVCTDCGYEWIYVSDTVDTKKQDISCVNINNKTNRERRTFFRNCMLQFQGKQNTQIDPSVIEAVKNEIKKIKIKDVKPDHVLKFIKELGYSKHVEDFKMIYTTITGNKIDDLSEYDSKIMADFDQFCTVFDELEKKLLMDPKTKNSSKKMSRFVNSHVLLYQLLRRHGYQCMMSQFSTQRTSDRFDESNNLIQQIFIQLNWNYSYLHF
jgi:hypothetical protein